MVLNNIGHAPAGLIVNRPTRVTVAQLFPEIESIAGRDDKVYFGGPVQTTSRVSFLFRSEIEPEKAARVLDGVYLSTDRTLLRNLLARDDPMYGLRVFVGYSGWSPDSSRRRSRAETGRSHPPTPTRCSATPRSVLWPDNARDVRAATSLRFPR